MTKPFLTRDQLRPCPICKNGLAHSGIPLVWKISVERVGIDARAVQRTAGLEQMLGGNVALANVFSPDNDFGVGLGGPITLVICEPCALENSIVIASFEELEKQG